MKDNLYKFVDAEVNGGDSEDGNNFLRVFLRDKTKALLAEASQGDMFGDSDGGTATSRYVTKPMGIGFDDKEHAIASTNNHPNKKVSVVDTKTNEVVYTREPTSKKSKKE